MHRHRLAPILALGGLAMGCARATPRAAPAEAAAPEAPASEAAEESSVLRPDQIFEILEQSPISYAIITAKGVTRSTLAEVTDQPVPRSRPVDPYVKLTGVVGPRKVESARPPAEIAELFGRAGDAFADGELEAARDLYAQAVRVAPDYFKSYTYLGNTLHLLGNHVEAEAAFTQALALNPVDYQALLFLGDTYNSMRQYHRAKGVLLRAYMLNRSSDAVRERLERTLAKLDLALRDERLAPEFEIERTGDTQVEMRFDAERGMRWLALAACMACWAYEERCHARSDEEDDPLRLSMYRECLINQAAALAVKRERTDGALASDEKTLLAAIEEGYLEAIIFWEVVGNVAPLVIYLLPEEVQEDILRYIERYVIVSTRLV